MIPMGRRVELRFIQAKRYLTALAATYPSPRQKEEVPTWFYSMRLHGIQSFHAYPYVVRCGGMLNVFGPDVAHKTTHPETGDVTLSCQGFNEGSVKMLFDEAGHPVDKDRSKKMSPEKAAHCQWRRCYKMVSL